MKFVFGTERRFSFLSNMTIAIVVFFEFYHGSAVEFILEHLSNASEVGQAFPTGANCTRFRNAVTFALSYHVLSYSLEKEAKENADFEITDGVLYRKQDYFSFNMNDSLHSSARIVSLQFHRTKLIRQHVSWPKQARLDSNVK